MRKHKGMEKAERAERIVNAALQSLARALERGESEGVKLHLRAMARFSRYSFGNVMLIFAQRPDAAHVEGFKTWQRMGRQVKKGEKGIMIRAPFTVCKENERNESGQEQTFIGFRAAYVFDASQTEGEPLPTLGAVSGEPGEYIAALESYAAAKDIKVSSDATLECDGVSRGGAVVIREGLSPAEQFSTLVHEIAHEILHQRETTARPPRTVRETEAEAVAFIVSEAVALDSLQASTDYIQLYQGNAATLWDSLDRIQQAASELIAAIGTANRYELAA